MHFRSLPLLIMLLGTVAAQTTMTQPTQLPLSAAGANPASFGSLAGTVSTLDNRTLHDVHVALRNVMTGAMLTSTTAASDGSFQIYNIPSGTYEVSASSGTHETRERIEIGATPVTVRLQLATESGEPGESGTVSVSQFSVPDKARREYAKAEDAYGKNKLPEAREHLERALAKAPQFAAALTLRGILEMNQGKYQEALSDLEQAVTADPGYARAYIAQGAVLNLEEKFDDAIRSLQSGARLAPDSWQGYFELSKTMLAKDQFEESLKYATKAAAIMNDFPEIRMVKGCALLGMHRYQEAANELEHFLAAEPSGPQADYARATLNQARALLSTSAAQ
jgi:tetratricopeptide (TPR) repeat protein